MTYVVTNIDTMTATKFTSLKKACEYAFNNKGYRFDKMLVGTESFNYDYAEKYKTFEEFYTACKALRK